MRYFMMGDLGLEPRTSGLRVRCATIALVTPLFADKYNNSFFIQRPIY
jgi:hypothetical protein